MKPELWKTCRILANESRLRILHQLAGCEEMCVKDIALAEQIEEVVAGKHLKQLHEHGFIQLQRKSKWAFYRFEEPISDTFAVYLATPLKRHILQLSRFAEGIRLCTAFTHPRRIAIVKVLMKQSRPPEELVQLCDISGQALYRHLNKLAGRNFIQLAPNICSLTQEQDGFKKALIEACTHSHT